MQPPASAVDPYVQRGRLLTFSIHPVITNTLGRIQIRTNAVGVALDDFEIGDGRHLILNSGLPNRRKPTIFLHLYSFTWIFFVHATLRIARLNPVLGLGYLIRFYEKLKVTRRETAACMVKWRHPRRKLPSDVEFVFGSIERTTIMSAHGACGVFCDGIHCIPDGEARV